MHSGPFVWLTKLSAKHVELVQKFVPGSRVGIFRNERTRSTPLVSKMTFWCVSYYLDSGPFGCLTKLGAKRAELVQKFVPRSRGGIFHNELCRSTTLDRKLTFWCVSYYLDAFETVWLAYKTRCKTCRTGAKVRARKSRQNFSQRTHQIHPIRPKLTFWCVSYYLDSGPFGCLPTLCAKRAELVQKFVPRSRVRIFRNECTQSTPLDPKLMFWCVSYYLCAFGTIWLPYEPRCKTGRNSAKLRATKSRQNFS